MRRAAELPAAIWAAATTVPRRTAPRPTRRPSIADTTRMSRRARGAFTLDKVIGCGGQPLREFGIRESAEVELIEDETGRMESAQLVDAAEAA